MWITLRRNTSCCCLSIIDWLNLQVSFHDCPSSIHLIALSLVSQNETSPAFRGLPSVGTVSFFLEWSVGCTHSFFMFFQFFFFWGELCAQDRDHWWAVVNTAMKAQDVRSWQWWLWKFLSSLGRQRSWGSIVGVALAIGWTAKGSEFESWLGQEFSLLCVIQTSSGAHPASYPMSRGGSFPGGKAARAWSWPFIVRRSRKYWSIHPLSHTSWHTSCPKVR
jgi:hypothetical protein